MGVREVVSGGCQQAKGKCYVMMKIKQIFGRKVKERG